MPRGWGFSSFYRVGGLNFLFAQGVGNSLIKKLPGAFAVGGDGHATL